jgi:hypothetical protein
MRLRAIRHSTRDEIINTQSRAQISKTLFLSRHGASFGNASQPAAPVYRPGASVSRHHGRRRAGNAADRCSQGRNDGIFVHCENQATIIKVKLISHERLIKMKNEPPGMPAEGLPDF